MPVEIERKFLVTHDGWRTPGAGERYRQGYLCKGGVTVRVRRTKSRGLLTIKGGGNGSVRPEFEYEIPVDEAEELLRLCDGPLIEKVRHEVWHAGVLWHVDEFAGENAGLVLAEVELGHLGQAVVLPDWIGEEVTADERYRNSRLAGAPQGGGPSGYAATPMQMLADVAGTKTGSTEQDASGCAAASGMRQVAQEEDSVS